MIYIRDAAEITKLSERTSIMMIGTTAYCGFQELGEAVEWYKDINEVSPLKEDVVVGSIGDMKNVFARHNISLPIIEYPSELEVYYGRKIWVEPSLYELVNSEKTNIFIKPAEGMKKFTGKVIKKPTDYCGLMLEKDLPVACSEPIEIVSEWRCYIRYGEILTIKNYAGDPFVAPSKAFVHSAIKAYETAPAAYAMDFAVLRGGNTVVLEVNEGYSLGVYGITPVLYAKLLSARYSQLVGIKDQYY